MADGLDGLDCLDLMIFDEVRVRERHEELIKSREVIRPRWLLLWSKAFVSFRVPRTCRRASILSSLGSLQHDEESSQELQFREVYDAKVYDSKVLHVEQKSMTVVVNGEEVPLSWGEVTAARRTKSRGLDKLFRVGEDVKVYRQGRKTWSMRALERVPGAVLHNKTTVFEEADETAKMLLVWQPLEEQWEVWGWHVLVRRHHI